MSKAGAAASVGDRELRRRCQRVVDQLELPDPFDIRTLVDELGQRRGRAIHLISMSVPMGPVCGVWLSTSDFDAICYEAGTSPLHQEHIIAHELGHLLSAHEAPASLSDPLSDDVARVLLPDLDPALIQRALNRSNYSTAEEREAEMIASLISMAASRRGRTAGWVAPPQLADVFARLEDTLERRPRG